jgi:DDE superfamily endonuclease
MCCLPTRKRRKKRTIRRRLKNQRFRSVTLFEDETDLLLFPPLRAAWSLRGESAPVPISGANAKRVIFGSINVRTGSRLLLEQKYHRGENFQAFLEFVHSHYRGWRVTMVLDEDSSHTAHASTALADWLGIELLWLPKRSPHLNPMDHLWRHGKEIICANWQYPSIEDQVESFFLYLYGLTPSEALHKAGVLSGNFWLNT